MKSLVSARIDSSLKEEAREVAEELGLSLTDIVRAAFRSLVRTREIHFSDSHEMSSDLENYLGSIINDLETGKNMSPPLNSEEDIREYMAKI